MKTVIGRLASLLIALGIGIPTAPCATQLATGFVKREIFPNIEGNLVSDLTGSAPYQDGQPDSVSLLSNLETPSSNGQNYGQRLSGVIVPPVSGSYVFFLSSADQSELWVAPFSDSPGDKQLIAQVGTRTGVREWNRFPFVQDNSATPFFMEAGSRYAFEVLVKSAGSLNDHVAVGWVLPDLYVDPTNPPDGLTNITVIPGIYLGGTVDTAKSSVTISAPPSNATSKAGSTAYFSVTASGTSDLGTGMLYQWRRNGSDIPGANSSSYRTPALSLSDDGASFTCQVGVPGKSVTTSAAKLTVLPAEGQIPLLSIAPKVAGRSVLVSWSGTDPSISLESSASLGATANWTSTTEQPAFAGNLASVEIPLTDQRRFLRLSGGSGGSTVSESLYPLTSAPNTDSNGTPGLELGTIFSSKTPGVIRSIRVYSLGGETGKRTARVWRNRDNTVIAGPYDFPCVGITGWIDLDLPQPLTIEPDVAYTLSVSTSQDPAGVYPNSANFFTAAGGNDKSLTFPAGAGVFSTQLGSRPTQVAANNPFYFRDVSFVAGSAPPENIITWALDLPVRLGRGGDTTARELGTIFRSSVPGQITGIRVLSTKQEGGEHLANIWKNSDDTLVGGPYSMQYGCFGQLCGDEWVVYTIDPPLEIEANTDYTVSVSTGTDANRAFPFLNQAFTYAGGNGNHLSYPVGAGVSGEPGLRPSLADANNASHFRDVIFVPQAAQAESETLLGGGAVYSGQMAASTELGTVFEASVKGSITGIRVYSLSVESGVHKARIWRNSDNKLLAGPLDLNYGGSTGWRVFPLPQALEIEANTPYTIAISTGSDASKSYPFVPDGFISNDNNTKHLSYPASAGVLSTTLGARPTESPNGHSYLRDVVFQPAAQGALFTIGNTTDATQADVITNPTPGDPTGTNGSGAYINGNQFTVTSDAILTKIKAKIGNAPGEYKCAIYSDLNGLGDRLLAESLPKSNPTTGWNEFPLTAPLKVKAGDKIWLVIWSNDQSATVYYSVGPGRLRWGATPYGPTWPDPIVMETGGNDNAAYCIYAEGTVDTPKPASIGNTTDATQADVITNPTPGDPTGTSGSGAYINGNQFTVTSDATLTKIKSKIGNAPGEYKCAIYSDLNGLGDRLLAESLPKSNPTTGWNEFPLTAPLKVKAGDKIWLVIWSNDQSATVYYSVGPGRLRWGATPYGPTWPDPIVMETGGNDNAAYCIYAEGTLD